MECPCCGQSVDGQIDVEFLREIKLPPSPHVLLNTLVDAYPHAAHRERIMGALWGDRLDGGPLTAERAVWVYIHRIRKEIKPFGWRVSRPAMGTYKLVPEKMK